MDTLEELVRNRPTARVSLGDKWLVRDGQFWEVYQRPYRAKKTRRICITEFLPTAIQALIKEADHA